MRRRRTVRPLSSPMVGRPMAAIRAVPAFEDSDPGWGVERLLPSIASRTLKGRGGSNADGPRHDGVIRTPDGNDVGKQRSFRHQTSPRRLSADLQAGLKREGPPFRFAVFR